MHRDLKPANIMIEADDDQPLIMDFGISPSARPPARRVAGARRHAGIHGARAGGGEAGRSAAPTSTPSA